LAALFYSKALFYVYSMLFNSADHQPAKKAVLAIRGSGAAAEPLLILFGTLMFSVLWLASPSRGAAAAAAPVRPEAYRAVAVGRIAGNGNGTQNLILPINGNTPGAAQGGKRFLDGLGARRHVPCTLGWLKAEIDQAGVFSASPPWSGMTVPANLGAFALTGLVLCVSIRKLEKARGLRRYRQVETERQVLAHRYQALVEELPAVTYMASPKKCGSLLYVSKQIGEVTGFNQEEWLSNPDRWMRQIHPEDREPVQTAAQLLRASGDLVDIVYRMFRNDGTLFWCRDRMVMVYDATGSPEFISGVFFDVTEQQEARCSLDRMNRELRKLSVELLRSQDEERRRLARDLHDSVGQNLVGLQLILSQMGVGEAHRQSLKAASELVDQTLNEIRTLSHLLHPPLLDEVGLTSALRGYLEGFMSRTGIVTICRIPAEFGRLEGNTELALFRIVQEALGNIYRHSGSREATVEIAFLEGVVQLTVADRGRGIPPEMLSPGRGGVGLGSMRQRAAQLGGNLDVQTGPGGTSVVVRLPVHTPRADSAVVFPICA